VPRRTFVPGDHIDVLVFFEEIGDIQEGIPIQAEVDERRLHARKNPRHASFVDAAGEGIFVGSLEINFNELIVLDQPHSGLVPVGRDH
jgi:hypothetical protein